MFESGGGHEEILSAAKERLDCGPPLIVAECRSGLMGFPRREEGILVKVSRVVLQIWACVGNRGVRGAVALYRIWGACADLEEPFLVAYCRLDVPLEPNMFFSVGGFFREDRSLHVRREILPPGACKCVQFRRV